MRKQSFLTGAFVLAVAGFVSKILGAVYRIPLYSIIGDEGFGLFQMAYPIYGMILVLSTTGINVAISRLVAQKTALGDIRGAQRVFKISLGLMVITGIIASGVLYSFAGYISTRITRDPRAYYSMVAISPAIFLVSIMSAYRGLFQGLQMMTPTAVSQIIEQTVRVVTMLILAVILVPRGIEFGAAGATFGAVTGAGAGLIYLLLLVYRNRPLGPPKDCAVCDCTRESTMGIVRKVFEMAIPISLASGVLGLIQIVDMALVPWRLQVSGTAPQEATALYGQMSGAALPLVNMPTLFTAAMQVSIVPSISEDLALANASRARVRAETALRVTNILMIPSAIGLYVLSREIPTMLFGDPSVGFSLSALAFSLVFLGLQQTTSGILQGLGNMTAPVNNLLIGTALKTVLTWCLTPIPSLGIRGACYGTLAGFLVAGLLNLLSVSRMMGRVFNASEIALKPAISGIVMAVAVRLSYNQVFSATASNTLSTLFAIVVGVVVYGIGLLMLRALRTRDLELVPGVGQTMAKHLKRMGLIKDD